MSDYWGYHLMLDCSGCNDNIKDREQIYQFAKEMVKRIDMIAHGEPIIEYMLPGDPKEGYSLMQLIQTSNICAHFVNPDNTAYIDIFSCKEYDIETAKAVVAEFFAPTKVRVNFITRHAN
jgi:S-adenosylmethionine/arginine decarboxylase-like enzyme